MDYDNKIIELKREISRLEFERDWNKIMPTIPFPALASIRMQTKGVNEEQHRKYCEEVEYAIKSGFQTMKEAFEKQFPEKK